MTDPTPNAPGPEPLSPAAQEVLDAVLFEVNAECHTPWIAAVAFRAAAAHLGSCNASTELIRIATELEGQ
jgi:hypothetical protein